MAAMWCPSRAMSPSLLLLTNLFGAHSFAVPSGKRSHPQSSAVRGQQGPGKAARGGRGYTGGGSRAAPGALLPPQLRGRCDALGSYLDVGYWKGYQILPSAQYSSTRFRSTPTASINSGGYLVTTTNHRVILLFWAPCQRLYMFLNATVALALG